MRKLPLLLLPLSLLLMAPGAPIDTDRRVEFTDCAAGGSAAQTITAGDYLFRVTDADTFLCFANSASTCTSGGEKFPSGTVMLLTIPGGKTSVSCRSATATGDAIFTSSR